MPVMARIHYEIPDELHRRVKSAAALEGVTLKEYVIRALEQSVAKPKRTGR